MEFTDICFKAGSHGKKQPEDIKMVEGGVEGVMCGEGMVKDLRFLHKNSKLRTECFVRVLRAHKNFSAAITADRF